MSAANKCPECDGKMRRRASGFESCQSCGKLVVVVKTNDQDLAREQDPTLPASNIAIPDYHETMIGWRAWGVKPDLEFGEIPLLRSVTYSDHAWTPGEPTEAECRRAHRGTHEVPHETHTCGLYSAKTRERLMSMEYHRYDAEQRGLFHVVGSVSLWGKIVEGSQGWRAQFGYPRELFLPFEAWSLAAPLTEAYGVPVRLNNILKQQEV